MNKERQGDVNERSKMISKLIKGRDTRESYIRSKLSVLLPAQIRSLRLRRGMKQAELGAEAEMKQGRISVLERIGEVSFSIDTLIKLASAFRVGLIVKFAPMSEMLAWENSFLPDEFDVVPVEKDETFIRPEIKQTELSVTNITLREAFSWGAVCASGQYHAETIPVPQLPFMNFQWSNPTPISSFGLD